MVPVSSFLHTPRFLANHRNSLILTPKCTISPPQPSQLLVHQIPHHPTWRFLGPPLSKGPLPAFLYLALTSKQSLQLPPFNVPAIHSLTLPSSTPFRVLSVTLPFHGTMPENEVALQKWATLYTAGADPVSNFVRRASTAIDELVDAGIVMRNSIVVSGLSRGALLAGLLAAKNANVRAFLGFAPVTVLDELQEFQNIGARARSKMTKASLMDPVVMKALLRMPTRFYMGNLDRRVGTRQAFEVVHLLAEQASGIEGVRSPPHEFIMYCSIGKDGHGTPSDVFEAGAEYAVSHINQFHIQRNN